MSENRSQGEHDRRESREEYEPPKLELLGTMVELTEGMGVSVLDLSGLRAVS
jgi:hypothetical protein